MPCGMSLERFRRHLLILREEYLRELTYLLGPRDDSYILPADIREVDGGPTTHFPHGYEAKEVEIHLSREAVEHTDCGWARWQLAHECVHLLDPGEPPTIVLEEGIATWNQPRKSDWPGVIDPPYIHARDLVKPWMDVLPEAVKGIRAHGIQMRHMTSAHLAEYCPGLSAHTTRELTRRFDLTRGT